MSVGLNGLSRALGGAGILILAALACVVAAPAAHAGQWLPPKVVAKTPEIDELPVARAGDGTATVVYVDRSSVWEREVHLDGTMSADRELAPKYSGEVALAMAPDGGATVLWVRAGDKSDVAKDVHLSPSGKPGPV